MTIIAHARIAERIDQSPTEQFSRLAPLPPVEIAAHLSWATLDIKRPAEATAPAWATTTSYPDELAPEVTMYGSSERALVHGFDGHNQVLYVRAFRLDNAEGAGTPIVEMGNQDLTAEQARRLAALLVEHADMIEGNRPAKPRSQPFRTAVAAFRLGRRVEMIRTAARRRGHS